MSKPKKESFFWTSYSDLMTSLFFVMLVLFVLVIVLLHNEMVEVERERDATQEQLDKIREIEKSIECIDSIYFKYDSLFKRHTLKDINVRFEDADANIYGPKISEKLRDTLLKAGQVIKNFVDDAVTANQNVKYLLIVEGQASNIPYNKVDECKNNDVVSYQRALALVKFWEHNNLNFNDNNCEVIISGSGTRSNFRSKDNERANQRFVIHIIPKTGEIVAKKVQK